MSAKARIAWIFACGALGGCASPVGPTDIDQRQQGGGIVHCDETTDVSCDGGVGIDAGSDAGTDGGSDAGTHGTDGGSDAGTDGGTCPCSPSCPSGTCPMDQVCNGGTCCTPNCVVNNCGPDGCGGVCGSCDTGDVCNQGVCCTPTCSGTCGDDGCGGTCGSCPTGQSCYEDLCCTPSCSGRCADDGCGNPCGPCPTGQVCEPSGMCCSPHCDGRTCGDDGCGGSCGTCASDGGTPTCFHGQCCTPHCDGRSCGDDSCGGSCGTCPSGNECCDGQCITGCSMTVSCSYPDFIVNLGYPTCFNQYIGPSDTQHHLEIATFDDDGEYQNNEIDCEAITDDQQYRCFFVDNGPRAIQLMVGMDPNQDDEASVMWTPAPSMCSSATRMVFIPDPVVDANCPLVTPPDPTSDPDVP